MEEELAEVVDGVGNKGCDAKIVGARSGFIDCEGFEIYASKVE